MFLLTHCLAFLFILMKNPGSVNKHFNIIPVRNIFPIIDSVKWDAGKNIKIYLVYPVILSVFLLYSYPIMNVSMHSYLYWNAFYCQILF